MIEPYYQDDAVTIYHGDCREILPTLGRFDSVVTDPPYGINWRPRVNHTGDDHIWKDDVDFDPSCFLEIGKYHLFWGAQYFANKLPNSESWLCWVKRPVDCFDFSNDKRTYSTIELAWTDFARKPGFKSLTWDGGMRQGSHLNRSFCHPSQKPIELMQWCVGKLPPDAETILDPFAGSCTTGVAAKLEGRKATLIEMEERYCEIGASRMEQGVLF